MNSTITTANKIHILSVEDSEAQQYLIAKALTKVSGKYSVALVGDGDEALTICVTRESTLALLGPP